MSLKVEKVDFSIDFIKFSKSLIENNIKNRKVVFITPNKRPIRFLEKILKSKDLLECDLYTINEFVDKICFMNFSMLKKQTQLERTLFFLGLIKKKQHLYEKFGNKDSFAFVWARRLSVLFNDFEKQLIDKVEDIKYQDALKEAKILLENLKSLYEEYKSSYRDFAFEGKCLFLLAKNVESWVSEFGDDQLFVFSGFGFMSRSEIEILRELKKHRDVILVVQTDLFERDIIKGKKLGTFDIVEELIKNIGYDKININRPNKFQRTNIEFYEFGLRHQEAAFVASQIGNKPVKNNPLYTAVVLPESETLFPLLAHLEDNIPLNVTMGYPFNLTEFGKFLVSLFTLLLDAQKRNFNKVHPSLLLKFFNSSFAGYLKMDFNQILKKLYDNPSVLFNFDESDLFFETIIQPFKQVSDLSSLRKAFEKMLNVVDIDRLKKNDFDFYSVRLFYSEFVNRIPLHREIDVDMTFAYSLVVQEMSDIFIPFEGHPLNGVQVMGVLESRMLNFNDLFILDVNEGVLPSGDKIDPLFPEGLKKSFGLTTFSQKEKLVRYNFFRLIYSSKNAKILYRASTNSQDKSLRSRYVEQLLLLEQFNKAPKSYTPSFSLPKLEKEVSSKEVDEFRKFLNSKLKTSFSPTEINELIRCPYAFYLKRVKYLDGTITFDDRFEAGKVGNIIHAILEENFRGIKGFIDRKRYLDIGNNVLRDCKNLRNVSYLNKFELKDALEYLRNLEGIQYDALIKVLEFRMRRFFENTSDKKRFKPFKVRDVEVKITDLDHHIFGVLDRVDELEDGRVRVVDYKTGYHSLGYSVNRVSQISESNSEDCCKFLESLSLAYNSLQMPIYRMLAEYKYKRETIGEMYYIANSYSDGMVERFQDNLNIHIEVLDKLWEKLKNCDNICIFPSQHCSFCEYSEFCVYAK